MDLLSVNFNSKRWSWFSAKSLSCQLLSPSLSGSTSSPHFAIWSIGRGREAWCLDGGPLALTTCHSPVVYTDCSLYILFPFPGNPHGLCSYKPQHTQGESGMGRYNWLVMYDWMVSSLWFQRARKFVGFLFVCLFYHNQVSFVPKIAQHIQINRCNIVHKLSIL